MSSTDIIGYIGSAIISIIFIPQIIQIYNTKDGKSISYLTQILSFTSAFFMIIYGYLISAIPIILCNIVVLLSSLIICLMKKIYSMDKSIITVVPI